jgi:hypothetical protein
VKQRFELIPETADVVTAYDMLRYENGLQKRRIEELEQRLADLQAEFDVVSRDRDTAQGIIDRLNAQLIADGKSE